MLSPTVLGMRLHDSSNHFLTLPKHPESVKRMHLENTGIEDNIYIIISYLDLIHKIGNKTVKQAHIGSQIASRELLVP
jgi:hypothetical protein